jgi:hypothetical protein
MQTLVPDLLWTDHAPMSVLGLPIGRRLCVARGASGQLVVFSPLEATRENLAALNALGPIAAFMLPNRFHDSYYDGYFEPFRGTPFLAPRAVIANHRKWPLTPLVPGSPVLAGFRFQPIGGTPNVAEHVFLHEATQTLIVADVFFNLPRGATWLTRQLLALAGMAHPPAPTRLFKTQIKDRAAFRDSLRSVLSWDFDRIVVGHGDVIHTAGKDAWRTAFREFID